MQQEEQITVKDILLKIISIKNSILKNWKIILLFGAIGGGLGFLYDYRNVSDPTYTSFTKFYLETATPSNDYGGFASMFGGGGGGGGGLFSGENLLTLINSTDFVEKILLKEVTIGGKKHILANYFHEKNKLPPKKGEKIEKDKFKPLINTNKNNYGIEEFATLGSVQGPATGAVSLKPEDKTSFMTLEVTTYDDTLSKVYSDVFLQTLKEYFLESKTGKIRTALEKQERIVDSLQYLLQGNENYLAKVQDQNQDAVFKEGRVQETRLTRKTQMLTEQFREQERTLNGLKIQLYQDSPLFKITSPQRFPLAPSKSNSLTKSYSKGIMIGAFLSLIFIILRDAIKSILKEEKK